MMLQLRRLLRQYQALAISVGILLACVVGLIFGIIPLVGKTYELAGATQDMQEQNELLQAKNLFLDSWDETALQLMLSDLLSAVPADKSITSLFTTMDGVTTKSGVTISDLTISSLGLVSTASATPAPQQATAEEKRLGVSVLTFSLTVVGNQGQFRDFMSTLVNARRFVRIKNFALTFADSEQVKARLDLDAFYSPYPKTLGGVSQALPAFTADDDAWVKRISSIPLYGAEVTAQPAVAAQTVVPREDPFSP